MVGVEERRNFRTLGGGDLGTVRGCWAPHRRGKTRAKARLALKRKANEWQEALNGQ